VSIYKRYSKPISFSSHLVKLRERKYWRKYLPYVLQYLEHVFSFKTSTISDILSCVLIKIIKIYFLLSEHEYDALIIWTYPSTCSICKINSNSFKFDFIDPSGKFDFFSHKSKVKQQFSRNFNPNLMFFQPELQF
jgi:hypothetical protein